MVEELGGSVAAASEGVALTVMGWEVGSFTVVEGISCVVDESAEPIRDDWPGVGMRR